MNTLAAYLPQDRRRALLHGQNLPDRPHGSALFADISGFTPLTEQLTQAFGARRGIEELTRRINTVYEALIGCVEKFGGSVISFAGDSIIYWFDASADHPSMRAVAAALSIQSATRASADISLKVAVTSGPARRFVVGEPHIQLLDTVAGETIARLARAEHLTKRGEVIADSNTLEAYEEAFQVGEWRVNPETNEHFAVIASSSTSLKALPVVTAVDNVPSEMVREWVLPTVFGREQSGLGEFLTELRPVVALFLRFEGIDYDGDDAAQHKLDSWIRHVQQVVAGYDGTLLQLTIGDKGSYVYACFGAPTAHEDDARRAVLAGLALRHLPGELAFLHPVQVGLSRGTLRVGAYGSPTRRTYGVLGDDVNLAARLMVLAAPGEILLTGRVQHLLAEQFTLEPRPPLAMKGKAEPLPVFAVTGVQRRRATKLQEPAYRLPMMGRADELAVIASKLELARTGRGQVVGITAEAGLGKSRLVAEAIRLAQRRGFASFGGACESSGTNSPYLVWKAIWQAFFDIDPTAPTRRQIRHLEGEIEDRAPHRLQAIPLLAPLLDVSIDDNDFTRPLEPKDRRNALAVLLEDCLRAAAAEEPVLFVLEDVHWIDPLSHDLLETVAQATVDAPVCIVLAYRPPELERLQVPGVEALPHFTRIGLGALTPADAEGLIRAKLAQLFPERGGRLPRALVELLTIRAQGNPFFIEELLNYLRDRGISPYDEQALTALELPASLHTLILSRIDQLTETQKATLKVASIIGRLFPFAWLRGYYPGLGTPESVKGDLDVLARLDITPLASPEPELTYLFKHIVTQEVAYESLAYATRAQLHEQLAQFIEELGADRYLDLLAFHYGRSQNVAKQREYFRKAGHAAAATYANDVALEYYSRALALTPEAELTTRYDLYLAREKVYDLLAERTAQFADIGVLEQLAEVLNDDYKRAKAALRHANYSDSVSDYLVAVTAAEKTVALAETLGLTTLEIEGRLQVGYAQERLGHVDAARAAFEQTLALSRAIGARHLEADSVFGLGLVAFEQGDFGLTRSLYEQAFFIVHELGDRVREANVLEDLAAIAVWVADAKRIKFYSDELVRVGREIGYHPKEHHGLGMLAVVATLRGELEQALVQFEEVLRLTRAAGDRYWEGWALLGIGGLFQNLGDFSRAKESLESFVRLGREVGSRTLELLGLDSLVGLLLKVGDFDQARGLIDEVLEANRSQRNLKVDCSLLSRAGFISQQEGEYERARDLASAAIRIAEESGNPNTEQFARNVLGHALAGLGELEKAAASYRRALALRHEVEQPRYVVEALAGLARVALAQGNVSHALEFVEDLLTVKPAVIGSAYEPGQVYLTCYQVLSAAHDPRAEAVLRQGYDLLQTRAALISDESMRRMYLENVLHNRELMALWKKQNPC